MLNKFPANRRTQQHAPFELFCPIGEPGVCLNSLSQWRSDGSRCPGQTTGRGVPPSWGSGSFPPYAPSPFPSRFSLPPPPRCPSLPSKWGPFPPYSPFPPSPPYPSPYLRLYAVNICTDYDNYA